MGFFEGEEDDGERGGGKVHVHEVVRADEFSHHQGNHHQTKMKQVSRVYWVFWNVSKRMEVVIAE